LNAAVNVVPGFGFHLEAASVIGGAVVRDLRRARITAGPTLTGRCGMPNFAIDLIYSAMNSTT
jgi:hypothetical protein